MNGGSVSLTIWLSARTLKHTKAGGHLWVYLNWALGLRALGCKVVWLEPIDPRTPVLEARAMIDALKTSLEPYGLAKNLALCSWIGEPLSSDIREGCLDLEDAGKADLFLNLAYDIPPTIVGRYRRSALVDIDPGLTQIWMSKAEIHVAQHDLYFTIGETVGQPGARFPDCGLNWLHTPPCVALDWWPSVPAGCGASFNTVSHWYMDDWMGDEENGYQNDKRTGFLPFLDLPRYTTQPLELALCLSADEEDEHTMLQQRGWRVQDSWKVTSTPQDYQRYIQSSLGEFSCVKPSCVRLQNAWISDRTLCYLASGKPAVVQNTGPSRFLPDRAGLFRFRDIKDAARCLERVMADYEQQCKAARALAEEHFDARKVIRRLLELALA
jgi:hypothetical protein